MPLQNLDAIIFVEDAPEIEYRKGLFHIRQRISDTAVIERVMRPNTFMLALRRAAEAAHQHKFGGAEIIDLASRHEEATATH
jgi:hypothetical protein